MVRQSRVFISEKSDHTPCTCNIRGTTLNTAREVSGKQTRAEIEGNQLDIGNRLPTNINDNRPIKRTLVLAEDPFIAVIMIYQILGTDYQPTPTDDGVG